MCCPYAWISSLYRMLSSAAFSLYPQMQEFRQSFEKLHGFKIKSVWAAMEGAGAALVVPRGFQSVTEIHRLAISSMRLTPRAQGLVRSRLFLFVFLICSLFFVSRSGLLRLYQKCRGSKFKPMRSPGLTPEASKALPYSSQAPLSRVDSSWSRCHSICGLFLVQACPGRLLGKLRLTPLSLSIFLSSFSLFN